MRVINAMFGRKRGVIEQTFLNYCNALSDLGCELVVLTYQDAPTHEEMPQNAILKTITNFGQWDPVASWKLKKIIRELEPDIIIAHGNRASTLLSKSITDVPVVSVCYNYNAKALADYKNVIAVTEDVRKTMIKKGLDENIIHTVPNLVNISSTSQKKKLFAGEVPVIGTIGKFISKRGLKFFLRSLAILKNRGIAFKAILAGDGPERESLIEMAASLNISSMVEFPGDIQDRDQFFSSIDIFCLPSLQEPFGVVVLEAFTHAVAVVTTDTEGPIEIVKPYIDSIVVDAGEDYPLADAFEKLIRNPQFAERIAEAGYNKVSDSYNVTTIANKLHATLGHIINEHKVMKEATKKEQAVLA